MKKTERRAAIAAYKETKIEAGVFAIRVAAAGAVWVGAARNLPQAKNREWFMLRQGDHRNRALQAAWTRHGEAGASFERLEALDTETPGFAVADRLKALAEAWRARLGAEPL